MASQGWLDDERNELAVDRILDAAAAAFATEGVGATSMMDIAERAGCSRATLYRHFGSRHDLHRAFVNRETLRLMTEINAGLDGFGGPAEVLARSVAGALERVRSDPALAAWFAPGDLTIAAELSDQSEVIDGIADGFLARAGLTDRSTRRRRARWLIRSITSFLVLPEPDPAEERRLITELLVPAVLADEPASAR